MVKRPIPGAKRLFRGANRPEPSLKFGHAGLGDDDSLGSFHRQCERQAATKPDRNLLHGTARNDELAIGSEEVRSGQLCLQGLQRTVDGVALTLKIIGHHPLVGRIAEGNLIAMKRNNLVALVDKERLLVLLHSLLNARRIGGALVTRQALQLL